MRGTWGRAMVCCLVAGCGSSSSRSTTPAGPPRVALTSVGFESSDDLPPDPEDLSGGGSMDSKHYFVTIVFPGVRACTDRVARVARDWASRQHLTLTADDPRGGNLIMHATAPELDGFVEVTYTVTSLGKDTRARVTLWYYTYAAERREASAVRALLEHHEVGALQDALLLALRCEDPRP